MTLEELMESGWDPCNPSPEAIEATARPEMGSELREEDRLGIHRAIIRVELIKRFNSTFRREDEDSQMRIVETAAVCFALRAAGHDMTLPSRAEIEAHVLAIAAWETGRYAESDARLADALKDKERWPSIDAQPEQYEPALTYRKLMAKHCPTDFEGNRSAAAQILRASEVRGVLPSHAPTVDEQLSELPAFTDEDIGSLLDVLTAKNAGQPLFYLTAEGKWRLGTEEGRDALEVVISPVEPIREVDRRKRPPSPPSPHDENACTDEVHHVEELPDLPDRSDPEPSPVDSAVAAEITQAVRSWLQDRRDQADAGSSTALAAEFFLRSREEDLTMESMAVASGMPPRTLRNACQAMQRDLGAFLRARGHGDEFSES